MEFKEVRKRDYSKEVFDLGKITAAVYKAMQSTNNGTQEDATNISLEVFEVLSERSGRIVNYIPSIEEIQDVVEQKLMKSEFLDVAKCYILYRNEQAQKRKPNIFEKRINLKPSPSMGLEPRKLGHQIYHCTLARRENCDLK